MERTKGKAADQGGQGGIWQTGWSHFYVQVNQEEQLGSETDHTTQDSSTGKESLKISARKNLLGCQWQEKLPGSQEFTGKTCRVLEHTPTHPPGNQHQNGPICLWVAAEVTESRREPSKQHCSLSDSSPHTAPQYGNMGCPILVNTLGSAPYNVTGTWRQRNAAQMKE